MITTFYDFLMDYIIPLFGDPSVVEYGQNVFDYVFFSAVSVVVVHFLVVVPYNVFLRLIRYKGWWKK